jgi:hypothetical protein
LKLFQVNQFSLNFVAHVNANGHNSLKTQFYRNKSWDAVAKIHQLSLYKTIQQLVREMAFKKISKTFELINYIIIFENENLKNEEFGIIAN